MHIYILRRSITALITVLIVATLIFIILRLIPGDPAQLILGLEAPQERVQEIRKLLGLDQPIYLQYLGWLKICALGISEHLSDPANVCLFYCFSAFM